MFSVDENNEKYSLLLNQLLFLSKPKIKIYNFYLFTVNYAFKFETHLSFIDKNYEKIFPFWFNNIVCFGSIILPTETHIPGKRWKFFV